MGNGLLHMCLGSVSLYDLSPTPTFTGFSLTSCFMHANLLSESSDLYRYFRPDPQTWFHFFHFTDVPISQVATKGWNKHLPKKTYKYLPDLLKANWPSFAMWLTMTCIQTLSVRTLDYTPCFMFTAITLSSRFSCGHIFYTACIAPNNSRECTVGKKQTARAHCVCVYVCVYVGLCVCVCVYVVLHETFDCPVTPLEPAPRRYNRPVQLTSQLESTHKPTPFTLPSLTYDHTQISFHPARCHGGHEPGPVLCLRATHSQPDLLGSFPTSRCETSEPCCHCRDACVYRHLAASIPNPFHTSYPISSLLSHLDLGISTSSSSSTPSWPQLDPPATWPSCDSLRVAFTIPTISKHLGTEPCPQKKKAASPAPSKEIAQARVLLYHTPSYQYIYIFFFLFLYIRICIRPQYRHNEHSGKTIHRSYIPHYSAHNPLLPSFPCHASSPLYHLAFRFLPDWFAWTMVFCTCVSAL